MLRRLMKVAREGGEEVVDLGKIRLGTKAVVDEVGGGLEEALGVLSMAMSDEEEAPDMSVAREQPRTLKDVLDALEKSAAFVRSTLPTIDDVRMMEEFRVMRDGKVAMAVPRVVGPEEIW